MSKEPFISVYEPVAGWKAIKYWWNDEDFPGEGFWEPWATSDYAYDTEAEAEAVAKKWAKDEGLEFKPRRLS